MSEGAGRAQAYLKEEGRPQGEDRDEAEAARFCEAVGIANIPTLLMVLVQLTGDLKWLEAPYRPSRGRGLEDNDSGGLPEDIQAEIRAAALEALLAWRAGAPVALPNPSEALLVRMLSVAMGEPVPEAYAPIIASGLGIALNAPDSEALAQNVPEGTSAVIVGAGMSGICAAVRFQEAGIPYTILEAGEDVGGTWRDNRYPGAGVDTPNHLYSYSFAKNDWSHYFALQGEIYDYFKRVAREQGVADKVRYRSRVTAAHYDPKQALWHVEVTPSEGEAYWLEATFLVTAVGVLGVPKVPPIPGLESFAGPCFHSAEWPEDLDLTGKRVAIVGNGASAMQIVPAIAERVKEMVIFASAPQWAAPFDQFRKEVPEPVRFLLREVPLYQAWYRQRLAWTFNDRIHPSLQKDPDWPTPERSLNRTNEGHRRFFTDYVKAELGERQDLLDKVLPDYPPFGKRMLLDNGWFRTVARDHVTLIDERLAKVGPNSVTSVSGETHEVDVLILCTGFKATNFLSTLEVYGKDRRRLEDVWEGDNARAYLGLTVPGFPNLFTLLGPNIGLGHGGSVIGPVEAQLDYLLDALDKLFAAGGRSLEVKESVYEAYNAKIDAAHERMVWTHKGMDNWYRNSRGRIVAITPFRHEDFWRMTRQADLNDYRIGFVEKGASEESVKAG